MLTGIRGPKPRLLMPVAAVAVAWSAWQPGCSGPQHSAQRAAAGAGACTSACSGRRSSGTGAQLKVVNRGCPDFVDPCTLQLPPTAARMTFTHTHDKPCVWPQMHQEEAAIRHDEGVAIHRALQLVYVLAQNMSWQKTAANSDG